MPAYTRLKNRSLSCWGCPSQLYRGSRSLARSFISCSNTFFIVPYGKPLESTNTGVLISSVWVCVLLRRFRGNVSSSSVSDSKYFEPSSPSDSPVCVSYPWLQQFGQVHMSQQHWNLFERAINHGVMSSRTSKKTSPIHGDVKQNQTNMVPHRNSCNFYANNIGSSWYKGENMKNIPSNTPIL